MIFRSQADRLKSDAGFRNEADYLNKMFDGWFKMDFNSNCPKSWSTSKKKGTPVHL